MYEPWSPSPLSTPLVVHVLPGDLARGAQVFARELRYRLDGPEIRHRSLTLFAGAPGALGPDYTLGKRSGLLRRAGYVPGVVPRLRRKLENLAADVVVAHGGEPLKYCVPACPAEARLVYYKIGSSEGTIRRRAHAAWHKRLIRSADKIVAISDDLATEALTLFDVEGDKLVTIPNGRDHHHFVPATLRSPHPGRLVQLIYVAHLSPTKRPDWFVELVRRLVHAGLPVEATMVGDGPMLRQVQTAAVGLPVDVRGRLRPDEVRLLLQTADLLVFPSRRTGEGMPGVYLEAGLSGLPVVTTAVAGAGTVVEQGVTGYITPVNDFDGLVERTRELVVDPVRRERMGQAARRRCLERFTMDAVADQWARLLLSVRTTPARTPT